MTTADNPSPAWNAGARLVDERTWVQLRIERIVEVLDEMRDEGYCPTHMRPLEDEFTFLRGRLSVLDRPTPAPVPRTQVVTLASLQRSHVERQKEWCPDHKPDLSFRGNELGGECGEAQTSSKNSSASDTHTSAPAR